MGNGTFTGGKFNLSITFGFNAGTYVIDEWEKSFRQFSVELYDATDGKMSIGTILVFNNFAGQSTVDAILEPGGGTSATNGRIKPATSGHWMNLHADERFKPGVILHEAGHYCLFLEDEYRVCGGSIMSGSCVSDYAAESACVMDKSQLGATIHPSTGTIMAGVVNEFCCETTHTIDNCQHETYGKSCWNTIADCYPGITAPASGERPNLDPPAKPSDPILWKISPNKSRYVVVLSLGPGDGPLLNNTFFRTAFFATFRVMSLSQADEFALYVPGLPDPIVISFTTDMDEDDLKQILDQLQLPLEQPPAAATLEQLTALLTGGGQVANQRIFWFGTTFPFAQADVTPIAQMLIENRMLFHALLPSGVQNIFAAQQLAFMTNGSFRFDPGGDNVISGIHRIAVFMASVFSVFESFAFNASEFHQLPPLSSRPNRQNNKEPESIIRYSDEDLARMAEKEIDTSVMIGGYDLPVLVEEGARQAIFAMIRDVNNPAWLYLERPDGTIVNPQDVEFINVSKTNDSIAGRWIMRVDRREGPTDAPFELFAAVNNPRVFARLFVRKMAANQIRVEALVNALKPVSNLAPVFLKLTKLQGNGGSIRYIPLLPNQTDFGPISALTPNGTYSADVSLEPNHNYSLQVDVSNPGTAVPIQTCSPLGNRTLDLTVPNFVRFLEQHLSSA